MNASYVTIVLAATLVVLGWYARVYMKTNDDFQIIQLNLSQITDDHLNEKYPILIEDKVVDISTLLISLFKYQYVFKKEFVLNPNTTAFQNVQKYIVLHNASDSDAKISIRPPTKSSPKTAEAVKLHTVIPPYNVLILPYKWVISIDAQQLNGYLLNDFIHRFFHR